MSDSNKLYSFWESGEIELVKVLLTNIDYWQTDLLLMKISLTNPIDIFKMCEAKGYSSTKYYFETYKQIKEIRRQKFKQLSFTDKVSARFFDWCEKFKRVHKLYTLPKEML
jgi:hypothetical protein